MLPVHVQRSARSTQFPLSVTAQLTGFQLLLHNAYQAGSAKHGPSALTQCLSQQVTACFTPQQKQGSAFAATLTRSLGNISQALSVMRKSALPIGLGGGDGATAEGWMAQLLQGKCSSGRFKAQFKLKFPDNTQGGVWQKVQHLCCASQHVAMSAFFSACFVCRCAARG